MQVKTNAQHPESTRREFLRCGWRIAALIGIAAGAIYVARTRRPGADRLACARQELCEGCGRSRACALPAAVRHRQNQPRG